MEFITRKSWGAWLGLIFGIILFGFTFWGIEHSLTENENVLRILLYIPTYLALVAYVYLIIGAFNMRYHVDDECLSIRWSLLKKKIYWSEFNEIVIVKGTANLFPFLSVQWSGYTVGLFNIKGLGPVRMCGTHMRDEFLYIKTTKGYFGLTPHDMRLADFLANKTHYGITIVDMDEIPNDVKGINYREDESYGHLLRINQIVLLLYILFIAIFYPMSEAAPITILLLVLAIPLFLLTESNAARLIQFSEMGAYVMLVLGLLVTMLFFILSITEILL